jgi:hypothetical protein
MANKKPLTPAQRQAFVDSLPQDQRNTQPKTTFDNLISHAAQPKKPKLEK